MPVRHFFMNLKDGYIYIYSREDFFVLAQYEDDKNIDTVKSIGRRYFVRALNLLNSR